MGLSFFRKSCQLSPAPAPNPDPSRWELLEVSQYPHAYAVQVKYLDCTNFDGVKVMVYRGKCPLKMNKAQHRRPMLDPHFAEDPSSPVARFRPDQEGWVFAQALAAALQPL